MWGPYWDVVWKSSLFLIICSALFVALFYHMIFVPDYRPGWNTMPFVWAPFVKTLYKMKVESAALSSVYVLNFMNGMSKILDRQKMACFTMLKRDIIFLFRAEAVEFSIFIDDIRKFEVHKKGYEYKVFHPLLKESIFTSEGQKWHARRKLLTPTFHFKILLDFMPVLQEKSMNLISKLDKLVDEPWVNVDPLMHSCSLDVILQTAMGIKLSAQEEEMMNCIDAVKKGIAYSVAQMFRAWLYLDKISSMSSLARKTEKNFNIIIEFIKKVIREKKKNKCSSKKNGMANGVETHKTNGFQTTKKNKAFLDLLLELQENDKSFTEEDILIETLTFFIAGFDTTGSALSYSLYLMGLHKDVQEKVHEELDSIFKDSERDITREDLNSMKYLESTIKESLRLYPPVPYYSRYATEDFKISDCFIKKGSSLVVIAHVVHRDPDIYPDPEKFLPERFFPENCVGRHPYAYLPFSAGQRNCIGQKFGMMEVKTILANVLRRFSVTSLDPRDKILGIESIGKRCSEPLRMKFSHRKT